MLPQHRIPVLGRILRPYDASMFYRSFVVASLKELSCLINYDDVLLKLVCLINRYLDTWILGVVSKQLRLLHGRVGDSTTSVNSLSPQMSELVEDAIAS